MLHVERKHNTAHNAKDKDNKKLRNNNEEPFILKNIWLYTKSRQKDRKKERKGCCTHKCIHLPPGKRRNGMNHRKFFAVMTACNTTYAKDYAKR